MLKLQNSPEGRMVSVNDMEMYYELHGEGDPLVLLHGFFRSGQIWEPFIHEFSKRFLLIIPDLRGHGRSTNPTGTFAHQQAALDVFALLDYLGVREFRAIGNSSGGMTLIHMATQQSDRIEAMVLASATTYFPEQACEGFPSVGSRYSPAGTLGGIATVSQTRGRSDPNSDRAIPSVQG